ncbi:MAG: metallopeptidase TldD-related protein [Phycisphaerae bacterium]|jgi:predicted Zn-dependent protease
MPFDLQLTRCLATIAFVIVCTARVCTGATPSDPDLLMNAMADELARSMDKLVLNDLPRPYFMQYSAEHREVVSIRASYGGLLSSDVNRRRALASSVRVGSYELDNTNFGGWDGGLTTLPLDDDYEALRHAIWRVTDVDYKRAVEAFARKKALLKEKNVEDRPDDLSRAEPVRAFEPITTLDVSRQRWEKNVKKLSALFADYSLIQDANVTFFGGVVNQWIANSEGTRLRKVDSGVFVEVGAELQAPEGMRLSDSRQFIGLHIEHLPPVEKMTADVRQMCEKLVELSGAPVLDYYSGPVLFEPIAAGMVFESLLADGVCARPVPLGSGGWGDDSLERKLGLRILPRSFRVYDDPTAEWFQDTLLAGAYRYDDEAVPPRKVELVKRGKLLTLLASRAPTRKIKRTTGHGRSAFGAAQAHIGCLYIDCEDGESDEQLKKQLIDVARDEGLEFALRIESMQSGGFGYLGDPIYVYKVFVEDGREQLVRGLEFADVEPRVLKDILAAGNQRKVYNSTAGIPSSIIAPAILIEELELKKPEHEFDKLPILQRPDQRSN